jgi:hypothetical protein
MSCPPSLAQAELNARGYWLHFTDDVSKDARNSFIMKFQSDKLYQSLNSHLSNVVRIPHIMNKLVGNDGQPKTVAFLVKHSLEPILLSALTSSQSHLFGDLLVYLREHHYLTEIKLLLESQSFSKFAVPEMQLSKLVDELVSFARSKNSEMVSRILKVSENGFVHHHNIYLINKGYDPVIVKYLIRSSATFCDLVIWTSGPEKYQRDNLKRIHLKTLRVLLPDLGSKEVIEALLNIDSREPFHTPSLQTAINSNWNTWAQYNFQMQGTFYLLWLLCLTGLFEVKKYDEWRTAEISTLLFCAVAVGTASFSYIEIMQYKSLRRQYLFNILNIRDVLSIVSTVAYLLSELFSSSSESFKHYIAALALFLNWIGLLYYFRAFERSAWIVYSLLFILKQLFAFLIIVTTIIISFTTTFRALYKGSTFAKTYDDTSTNAFGNVISAFDTMIYAGLFGDYDESILGETYSYTISRLLLLFLLYTVPVVSLNAMIAFISDIFERILAEKEAVLTRIKAETMLQLFCTMSDSRRKKIEEANRWTYVLVPNSDVENVIKGKQNPKVHDEDDDTGMNRRATKQHLLNLENEIEEKMSRMEDKMRQMVENEVTQKLDAILSALQKSSETKKSDKDDTSDNNVKKNLS